MLLKQLELLRFKRFVSKTIQFAPGLNIIRGPNESGKSTLRLALITALFGNPTSTSESIRSLSTWGQPERCELRLDFLADQVLVKVRKDFAANKIFMLRGEESLRTFKSIQEFMGESLGIATEEMFELCASLDVRSLSNLGNAANRKQVGKMLAGLMTGTSSGPDVLQALKQLENQLKELGKGERSAAVKTPGPLKAGRELVAQLKLQHAQAQNDLQVYRSRAEKYAKLSAEVKAGKESLAGLQHLLAANEKCVQVRQRKAELEAQDQDFEKHQQEQAKLKKNLEQVSVGLAQEPLAACSLETISRIQELNAQRSQLEKAEPAGSGGRPTTAWLLGAGGALAGLGLLLAMVQPIPGLLLLLAGSAMVFWGWIKEKEHKTKARQQQARRDQWQRELEQLDLDLADCLKSIPSRPIPDILQAWPGVQKQMIEKNHLEKLLADFRPLDEERWKSIRRDLRLAEDVLGDPALQALVLPPAELALKQREFQKKAAELESLQREQGRLEVLLEHERMHEEKMAEIEERLSEAEDKVRKLERWVRVLTYTYETLDRARRDTLNPARQILEKRGGELLSMVTRGRYQNIAVDDEDLSSKILIPETGQWESPDLLSQGAFDQFFLCLRLALAEVLAHGKKAPLLLDEPLAAFDPERAEGALACLKSLAQDRQILFFTCRPDYDHAADQIIVLD